MIRRFLLLSAAALTLAGCGLLPRTSETVTDTDDETIFLEATLLPSPFGRPSELIVGDESALIVRHGWLGDRRLQIPWDNVRRVTARERWLLPSTLVIERRGSGLFDWPSSQRFYFRDVDNADKVLSAIDELADVPVELDLRAHRPLSYARGEKNTEDRTDRI